MKKLTLNKYAELARKYDKAVLTDSDLSTVRSLINSSRRFLDLTSTYKSCYFWTPKGNAKNRRDQETRDSFSLEAQILDIEIDLSFQLSISCNNFYTTKTHTVNELKDLLKRVQNVLYVISFDKHRDLISQIDDIINVTTSDSETLFDSHFYKKNVACHFQSSIQKMKEMAGFRIVGTRKVARKAS